MLVAGAAGPGGVGARVGQAPRGSGPWKEGPCGLCRCHGKRTFPKGFHHAGGTASALPLRQWGFQEGYLVSLPLLLGGSWLDLGGNKAKVWEGHTSCAAPGTPRLGFCSHCRS